MKHIPKYLKKLARVQLPVDSGKVFVARICHDDWCDQLNQKGACNCDPEIIVTEVPEEESSQNKEPDA